MADKTMTLMMRCKKFFGYKPGQSLSDFMAEMKQLTLQDKKDLVQYFNEAGMPTTLHAAKTS